MSDAFYIRDSDDRFISTDWTIGPWSRGSQHAGPPAALLGWAIERVVARPDLQVARITCEILRPVPVAPLRLTSEVIRPGRSVTLAAASLSDATGEVMRAQGWLIRTADVGLEQVVHGDPAPGGLEQAGAVETFPTDERSYLAAMEWRSAKGGFLEPGPAAVWARMRHPLVQDEETTPLVRVLTLADSGNGISSALDFSKWVFMNPDLTVHLHRLPAGEWVCLDAQTTIEPNGIGLATSTLSDAKGVIGRGLQSLFVGPRG